MSLKYSRFSAAAFWGVALVPSAALLLLIPASRGVGLVLLVPTALMLFWRTGVRFDPEGGRVVAWHGPGLELFSKDYPLRAFATVSVMEDSVEVFSNRGVVSERRYSSKISLKVQTRFVPGAIPEDDPPPPLTLRVYGTGASGKRAALEEGRALANRLGLTFRSDIEDPSPA